MNLFKKKRALYAVCNGKSIPQSEIPDEAFASGMLGQGFGVEPSDGLIRSPADGKIQSIAEARHAYTLLTKDGLDVLIHVGIDTVTLGGKGFLPLVREGDEVRIGQPIARADLDLIRAQKLSPTVAVLVTEPDGIDGISFRHGTVVGGKDAVMSFRLR